MQRRTTFALAAVAALLLAAGCSNDTSGGAGANTLTMYAISDNRVGYEPIISAFEAANPGVTVNVTYGNGNDFESTLNTQLASGNAPDLLAVQPGRGNLVSVGALGSMGYLADLSDQGWVAGIPASLRSQTDLDGRTYLYPEFLQPLGAFYNTQAMQAAGLTAPTTWSEVLRFCGAAAAGGRVAYSLGLSDQWVTQLVPYALTATLVYGDTPDWNQQLVDGRVTFPDSAWLTAQEKYMEMRDAGCFSENPNGISFENSLIPPSDGSALGIVQVGGVLGNLQSNNEEVVYDLQPLPATDDPAATRMPGSLGVGLAVNARARDVELATRFIEFVAQPEQINSYVESIGGGIPAIANNEFEVPQTLATFSEFVENGAIRPFPDTEWPNPRIQNAHYVGVQEMFLGAASPREILQRMQDAVGR